jgi:hypothetical protein
LDEYLYGFANLPVTALDAKLKGTPPTLKHGSFINRLRGKQWSLPIEESRAEDLNTYQELVRQIWQETNTRIRRFLCAELRMKICEPLQQQARATIRNESERAGGWKPEFSDIARFLPPPDRFELAVDRLEDLATRTKICGNSDCSSPYFIAERKSQRYCSTACADIFQQQAKREWWRLHGKEWRSQRVREEKNESGKA